jgi:hypothetical protein
LVLILDDLELANADQPAVVVQSFLDGIRAHLDKLAPRLRQATSAALRAKVSLHFAAPMIESWLFADPGGLDRITARSPQVMVNLACGPHFEDFATADADYLADDCSGCVQWSNILARPGRLTPSKRRANEPEWCRGGAGLDVRTRHPKRYLAWLCGDPGAKKCSAYKERDAATALREMDWAALMNSADMPFLYSLIDDLAQGLDEPCDLPEHAVLAPRTRRKPQGEAAVLRNM